VKPVNVLGGIDRLKELIFVEGIGEGKLNNNSVGFGILVELLNPIPNVLRRGIGAKPMDLRFHPDPGGLFFLHADVVLRGLVFSYKYYMKGRNDRRALVAFRQFVQSFFRYALPVDECRRQQS